MGVIYVWLFKYWSALGSFVSVIGEWLHVGRQVDRGLEGGVDEFGQL